MLPGLVDLILVAVLPSPRDFEIARLLGWYRIPLRTAPKILAVDYIAFYQPASFGANGGRIEYVAEVLGHELTTRGELLREEAGHPRAREEYFKVQLGGLIRLVSPIVAGNWKRFAFFYTTGAYLAGAVTLDDLVVPSDDRQLVWEALHERAGRRLEYRPAAWPPEIDAGRLFEFLADFRD